jgi:DNA-directed RNA polymerase subunit beta
MQPKKSAVIASAGSKFDENGYFVEDRVSARNRLEAGEIDANDVTHMDASRSQTIGSSAGLVPFIEKNYVLALANGF